MTVSMTGYGREVVECGEEQFIIEIRTVNHRFLDISTHIPGEFLYFESTIKDVIKTYFERGSVDVYIYDDNRKSTHKALKINWQLMDQYVEQLNEMKNRYHLDEAVELSDLLKFPDIFNVEEEPLGLDRYETSILKGVHDAAKSVTAMRQSEGMNLKAVIIQQVETIKKMVILLQKSRETFIQDHTKRIRTRIEKHMADFDFLDEGRLEQEIAVLAEKGDITEELTRIESHIDHFTKSIHSPGQIGRTLEFIIQEMHRETNTIASKLQDASMNEQIISMKRYIEKIKEQIQNIE